MFIYTKIRDQNLNHFIDPTGGMWGKCNESVLFHHSSSSQEDGLPTPPELEYHPRPTGFRGIFTNTHTQVVFLGFVCFMCPGLFNALNGLGGSGQLDQRTSANANSALYATFAVAAFFAG